MTTEDLRHWGSIDGVSIDFPLTVKEMNSAALTFMVPMEAARAVVPGDGFEVTDMGGQAMLILVAADYIQNLWGDYNEVNFGVMVNPVGQPEKVGAFQWRMPVDQEFTCKAGNDVLGLPKTVEQIEFDYSESSVAVSLEMGGEPTLKLSLPRAEPTSEPSADETLTYSYLDGVATLVPLTIDLPTGIVDPTQVTIELGTSTAANELAAMGLPKAPDLAMWGESLSGTFQWPEAIT